MTRSSRQSAWRTIGKIAMDSGYNTECIGKILFPEFSKYLKQDGEFSKVATEDVSALNWWKRLPYGGILKKVGIRVASLRSSSANIERIFSLLKIMQHPMRTSLTVESTKNLLKGKLAFNSESGDRLLHEDITARGRMDPMFMENSLIANSQQFREDPLYGLSYSLISNFSSKEMEQYNEFSQLVDFSIVNLMIDNSLEIVHESQNFNECVDRYELEID